MFERISLPLQNTLLNKKDRAKLEELSALCLYQLRLFKRTVIFYHNIYNVAQNSAKNSQSISLPFNWVGPPTYPTNSVFLRSMGVHHQGAASTVNTLQPGECSLTTEAE